MDVMKELVQSFKLHVNVSDQQADRFMSMSREEMEAEMEMSDAYEQSMLRMLGDAEMGGSEDDVLTDPQSGKEEEEEEDEAFNITGWTKEKEPMPEQLMAELEEDGVEIPFPPTKFQKGLFYLGRNLFARIHGRTGQKSKSSLFIEIMQNCTGECNAEKKTRKDGACICPRVVLTHDQWVKLLYYKRSVQRFITAVKNEQYVDERKPLGDEYHLSVSYPYKIVSIRKWFKKDKTGPLLPCKKGLGLKFSQYERLLGLESWVMELSDQMMEQADELAAKTVNKRKRDDEDEGVMEKTAKKQKCPSEFQKVMSPAVHPKHLDLEAAEKKKKKKFEVKLADDRASSLKQMVRAAKQSQQEQQQFHQPGESDTPAQHEGTEDDPITVDDETDDDETSSIICEPGVDIPQSCPMD